MFRRILSYFKSSFPVELSFKVACSSCGELYAVESLTFHKEESNLVTFLVRKSHMCLEEGGKK